MLETGYECNHIIISKPRGECIHSRDPHSPEVQCVKSYWPQQSTLKCNRPEPEPDSERQNITHTSDPAAAAAGFPSTSPKIGCLVPSLLHNQRSMLFHTCQEQPPAEALEQKWNYLHLDVQELNFDVCHIARSA